jgi:hypothetical protein
MIIGLHRDERTSGELGGNIEPLVPSEIPLGRADTVLKMAFFETVNKQ